MLKNSNFCTNINVLLHGNPKTWNSCHFFIKTKCITNIAIYTMACSKIFTKSKTSPIRIHPTIRLFQHLYHPKIHQLLLYFSNFYRRFKIFSQYMKNFFSFLCVFTNFFFHSYACIQHLTIPTSLSSKNTSITCLLLQFL